MLSIEGRGVLNPFVRVVDGTVPSNELSQALVEIERRTNTESGPSYVNGVCFQLASNGSHATGENSLCSTWSCAMLHNQGFDRLMVRQSLLCYIRFFDPCSKQLARTVKESVFQH